VCVNITDIVKVGYTALISFGDNMCLLAYAPLYLRTLWRYTNAVIIIIIMT